MTERPAWLSDRIADLTLELVVAREALARVQVVADNELTDPQVRDALNRALGTERTTPQ